MTLTRRPAAGLLALVIAAALTLAAIVYYRAVWGDIAGLVTALDHCPDLFCDFTRQYYPTGRDLPITGQPSRGYYYIDTAWPHYFVYLPFVQTLAVLAWRSEAGATRWRKGLLLIVPSIVLVSMPFFQFVGRWQDYSRANLLLLIYAYLTLSPTVRRPAAEE